MRRWILMPLSLCAVLACAQQKPAPEAPATSTVSGRVFCADTNTPARVASVALVSAAGLDDYRPGEDNKTSTRGEGVDTSLDGSFTISHVLPGTYYVIASMPGYISPLDSIYIPAASESPAQKKPAPSAPRITVQSGLPVSVNVSIERGAAVSGTVQYDDGSPAAGIRVSLLVRWKDKWSPIPSSPFQRSSHSATTDDRGVYRIGGLPPGKYVLEIGLQMSRSSFSVDQGGSSGSSSSLYSLDLYSGGKVRIADAIPFSLSAGEERFGEDIEIPVSKMHTIRGNILAARDGHVINGGSVSLLYTDDKSMAAHAPVSQDDDSFTFSFVLEGDYILNVGSAADMEYIEIPNPPGSTPFTRTESRTLHAYGAADQPIHVSSDLSGVSISVPEAPQGKPVPKP